MNVNSWIIMFHSRLNKYKNDVIYIYKKKLRKKKEIVLKHLETFTILNLLI